jgi:hypothetical protein
MCPLILGQFVHHVYCLRAVQTHLKGKGKATSELANYRRRVFQDVEAPRFPDSRYMKVLRMSGLSPGRLCPPGNIPGTHLCWGLGRPQDHSEAGWIMSMKNFNDTGNRTRILHQLRHTVPQNTFTIYFHKIKTGVLHSGLCQHL